MAIDVGPQLREIREQHGLSQRALAKRSGISNATISLIESGKLNPPVAVLKQILDGVQLDLATFFATEASEPEPVVYRADELVEIGRGKISYWQVGRELSGREAPGTLPCFEFTSRRLMVTISAEPPADRAAHGPDEMRLELMDLQNALAQLVLEDAEQAALVMGWYLEDKDVAQLAVETGLSPDKARYRRNKGLRRLKELLGQVEEVDDDELP